MAPLDISQFPEYRQIPLSKGYVAIVDACDYEWLMQFKWHAQVDQRAHTVYAVRNAPTVSGTRGTIRMHREILGAPPGVEVDHEDTDGLNNRRYNLRLATHAQNMHNQRPQEGGTSRYKGVYWYKPYEKWRAGIRLDGKQKHLGYFTSEAEAALTYNDAAKKNFGEFAWLNQVY